MDERFDFRGGLSDRFIFTTEITEGTGTNRYFFSVFIAFLVISGHSESWYETTSVQQEWPQQIFDNPCQLFAQSPGFAACELSPPPKQRTMLAHEATTGSIIGAAVAVHQCLGPGLLESAYEECIAWELLQRGHAIERQRPLKLDYYGVQLDRAYRLDIVVDQTVLVEIKSVERLDRIHTAQVLTYLKLSGLPVGLLINFNAALLREGIRRLVI